MTAEHRTANLHVRLEPPDLVVIKVLAEVVNEDMVTTAAFYEKHIRDWPAVFVMVEQHEQAGITAEARKTAAKVFGWVPFRGSIFYRGTFAVRTIGRMIMTLLNATKKLDNPIMFVSTEAEARAWIEGRRRDLAKKT